MAAAAPVDARRALLAGLIDHAPMFPPAELPLDEAVADHAAARSGDAAWVVARFVCRASALAALPRDTPPRLSVVVDGPWAERPALDDPRIEALELLPPADLALVSGAAPEIYVELPARADLEKLARHGLRAKIRCGGAALPTVRELARFVRAARNAGIAFKATAGLHHAVRTGGEHGFLNLLAAATFGDEEAALGESDPSAFSLTGDGFRWRDRTASPEQVAAARRDVFVSFGSCSFDEPVDDLRARGLL